MFLIFREYHPRIVLRLFLIFCYIWGSCSHKIVLIKKRVYIIQDLNAKSLLEKHTIHSIINPHCHRLTPQGLVLFWWYSYLNFLFDLKDRLVFSQFFDIRGNLRNVKEKPTRKTCFSYLWNEAPGLTHLPCKILLGAISLMSTEFLL